MNSISSVSTPPSQFTAYDSISADQAPHLNATPSYEPDGVETPAVFPHPHHAGDGIDGDDVNKFGFGAAVGAAVLGWVVNEVLDAVKEAVKEKVDSVVGGLIC